ncbi:hypothetical protein Pfo_028986 [Paulownia fortunei]|nr:hypothetical protein Pfo_028986 [Paulownia fortunei]
MAASVQLRPQNRDLGMVMREVDEDLAIFLGMQNGGKERKDHLLIGDSDEFDDSTGAEPKPDSLLIQKTLQPETVQIVADDNFLNLEIDRSDYDWLLMQRDISLLPSEEVQGQDLAVNQTEISNGEGIPLKSEAKSASLTNSALQLGISTSLDSSVAANRRSLSSGDRKPTPRAATPTGQPALPAKSRPSRASTPTSRATLESRAPQLLQEPHSLLLNPWLLKLDPPLHPDLHHVLLLQLPDQRYQLVQSLHRGLLHPHANQQLHRSHLAYLLPIDLHQGEKQAPQC